MTNYENKTLKKKNLDKDLTLKVVRNGMSGRISVDFASQDGKMVVQKSFPDTFTGKRDAEEFQKKFKSIKDLRQYLGLEKK